MHSRDGFVVDQQVVRLLPLLRIIPADPADEDLSSAAVEPDEADIWNDVFADCLEPNLDCMQLAKATIVVSANKTEAWFAMSVWETESTRLCKDSHCILDLELDQEWNMN